jgi:hypothetical protein
MFGTISSFYGVGVGNPTFFPTKNDATEDDNAPVMYHTPQQEVASNTNKNRNNWDWNTIDAQNTAFPVVLKIQLPTVGRDREIG